MRPLLAAVLLLCACPNPTQCSDCCPPGEGPVPVTFGCRLLRADGGPAAGVGVRCGLTDAGAVTDSNGDWSLAGLRETCGFATGSIDCGKVAFTADGGALDVTVGSTSAKDANASIFATQPCTSTAR